MKIKYLLKIVFSIVVFSLFIIPISFDANASGQKLNNEQCIQKYSPQTRSAKKELYSLYDQSKSIKVEIGSLITKGKQKHKDYLISRQVVKMDRAKELAIELDTNFNKITDLREYRLKVVKQSITKILDLCSIYELAMQDRCLKKANFSYSKCKTNQGYEKREQFLLALKESHDGAASTWRKEGDYSFGGRKHKGFVSFITGRAFVERGIKTLPAKVGTLFHVGDKINVEEGSQVTIYLLGSGEIKITEKTSFQIPETELAGKEPGLAVRAMKRAWKKTRKLLKGEQFEIKTPTATAGVRG